MLRLGIANKNFRFKILGTEWATKFATKPQCVFYFIFYKYTLGVLHSISEWTNANGINTISGSPKKWLADFELRPKWGEEKKKGAFCRDATFLTNCISSKQNHLISTFSTQIC